LPQFVEGNDVDWDVVYDARGHFTEPHTGKSFGIGTLEVRQYLNGSHDPDIIDAGFSQAKVQTSGPSGNFGAVLFIEKEGFDPLFKAARIAEKFDLAIKSTKGMSVTAARQLADEMCSEHNIPLLVLHDFDKAGFSIAGTLQRDTRRYEFRNDIIVIDLGLSLADVEAMGLEAEYQYPSEGTSVHIGGEPTHQRRQRSRDRLHVVAAIIPEMEQPVRIDRCYNVKDFRLTARRRLPGPIFHYIDGAADDEVTYRRNTET
jgi:hypothetical protein